MAKTERLIDYAATAVLAAVALVALLTFRDYGLGWDDYTHSQYGQLLLDYYRSGLADKRALSFVNLYMYGGGFDMAAALLDRITPFDLFETRRLFGAMIGIVGLAGDLAAGAPARRRKVGPWAGLAAVLLLATCPQYYGHMFINPKDAPLRGRDDGAPARARARALEEYPRPSVPTVLIFGLGLGLAIGSRILAGMAALYMLVPLAMIIGIRPARDECARRGREFRALRSHPPARPRARLRHHGPGLAVVGAGTAQSAARGRIFLGILREALEGNVRGRADLGAGHAAQLHPGSVRAEDAGDLHRARGLRDRRQRRRRVSRRASRSAAAPPSFSWCLPRLLPVAIAIVTRPAMYNGIRHFLFVIPPLAVLGGLAAGFIIETIRKRSQQAAIATSLVMLAGVIVPVTDMVRIHPYQYANFNRIAGGIYEADDNYMLDYWGLAFKQAAQELRDKLTEQLETPTKGRRWRVAVCGPHAAAEVELGPEFVTTWEPKGADFAMMLGTYYCAEYDAPVLVEIEREDVVFARVYDIRGKNYTSVFNNPTITPQTGPQQQ